MALLVAVASSLGLATSQAYVYEPGKPSWASGSVTFQMSLGSAGRTLSDGNTSWDAAAAPAVATWNLYMQRLTLVSVVNPGVSVSRGDRVNSISFASTFFGQSFGSNTLAITSYSYSTSMSEADVLFNNHIQWDSYRGSLRFGAGGAAIGDIRRVLIHELGHALGLDHPDQHGQHVSAVMNSIISNVDTAAPDDISGVQSLYGAGSSGGGATPTPTPTPTPTATPLPTPSLPSASVSSAQTLVSASSRGTDVFTISISAPSNVAITVNYVMTGKAVLGLQYSLSGTPGHVVIPAGQTSATVTLTALSAGRKPKPATMVLTTGTGYAVSSVRNASVKISR